MDTSQSLSLTIHSVITNWVWIIEREYRRVGKEREDGGSVADLIFFMLKTWILVWIQVISCLGRLVAVAEVVEAGGDGVGIGGDGGGWWVEEGGYFGCKSDKNIRMEWLFLLKK